MGQTKTVLIALLVGFVLASLPSKTLAFNIISCSEPKGLRYNYDILGQLGVEEDGFKGASPTFRVDPQDGTRLIASFSDSEGWKELLDEFGLADPSGNITFATIIRHDASTLSAVEVDGKSVWTYTFFKDHKVGFYSRHAPALDSKVSAIMLVSSCRFSTG